ncbi:MAG: hypothetical protein SFY32_14665 [Bacteroidota bacterium]|nr:hypothetical protein [Bacteroidota bacterium]
MITDFRTLDIADIFLNANPKQLPLWGTMNLHQMIEHITQVIKYSNGRQTLEIPESLPDFSSSLRFLMGPNEFPQNIKSPFTKTELQALQFVYFEDALMDLIVNIEHFDTFFLRNPDSKPYHPTFGFLTKDQWIVAHNKHFTHHFKQFGIST